MDGDFPATKHKTVLGSHPADDPVSRCSRYRERAMLTSQAGYSLGACCTDDSCQSHQQGVALLWLAVPPPKARPLLPLP